MMGRACPLLARLALLAGAFAMPSAAPGQCRLCATPTTQATTESGDQPMRIEVQARLDFDRLVMTGGASGGSARLSPDGTAVASGSIGVIGGRAMVGSVLVRGEPGRFVRIELPAAILLHGRSGGTIRLDSLVTDLPASPRLDSQGTLQFRFGGALHVQGDAEGEYLGDVPITVDYL